ncbi:MAG: DUF1295 domain-containing protein [Desulfobacterales bacterium]|nr:DUF1295 domain-containing protein [Desulfobacterales bacterium]
MTAWYLAARALSRFDVADIAWGPGFIVAAGTAAAVSDVHIHAQRAYLVMALVAVWGIRLSLHVSLRNRGKPEDARYTGPGGEGNGEIMRDIRAFFQVFLLRGFLLLVVAMPVILVITSGTKPLSLLDAAGVLVWITGFLLFEAVADSAAPPFPGETPRTGGRSS